MRTRIFIILIISCLFNSLSAQTADNHSDQFLTSSFKVFHSADFELAYHMLPFIRERFKKELEDTNSFLNPYNRLSKYIGIQYSSDSMMKTYCWSERNGSCCHTSATFAQFKTTGKIKYIDLEELEDGNEEIFIKDLQMIEIQNKPYYLILGNGTCCGGKHYGTARLYSISNDTLVKSDSIFHTEGEIYVGANRSQEIKLNYSQQSKILSYNKYEFDNEIGFYTEEKSIVMWKLTKKGFIKIN